MNYDINKIESALFDFYNSTGIVISLLNADFSPLNINFNKTAYCATIQRTAAGAHACLCSDHKLLSRCRRSEMCEAHTCHAGLTDIAAPVKLGDTVIGYIILGQIRTEDNFSELCNHLSAFLPDISEAEQAYHAIPKSNSSKIKSISNLAVMLADYLPTLLKSGSRISAITDFIESYPDKKLSVDYISKNLKISKNTLYKEIRAFYNCTVSEYINFVRIKQSVPLLLSTELSIEEISRRFGFSSASYYTKQFKIHNGVSPLKYRKQSSE